MSKYKYLSLPKLIEIRDNPTQMIYEDKYCDVQDEINQEIEIKLEKLLDKEVKAKELFSLEYPYLLRSGKEIEYIKEYKYEYYLGEQCLGDIFSMHVLINKLNDIYNMSVTIEEN